MLKIKFSETLIRLGLYVLVPLSLLCHGVLWILYKESSAVFVYLMKLSYLFVLVGMVLNLRGKIVTNLNFRDMLIILGYCFVCILSLIIPVITNDSNFFYYITDFVGFALVPIYYIICLSYIRSKKNGFDYFLNILINATFLSSLVVIFYYFISGGDKVSIPPEIHFGGALAVSNLLFSKNKFEFNSFTRVFVIVLACVLSQQRINLIVIVIPIIVFIFLNFYNLKKIFVSACGVGFIVAGIVYFKYDMVEQVVLSFAISESQQGSEFEDASANQRITEMNLIIREMTNHNDFVFLMGKGFGAEYENYAGAIPHYEATMHHAHSSPTLIWLRNGVIGVFIVFSMPLVFFGLLKKSELGRVAYCGLLCTFTALLVDQYIYWGALFSLSLAMCSSLSYRSNSTHE